jgi:ABC-type multidrug transport system fused ATPase/permease subunit
LEVREESARLPLREKLQLEGISYTYPQADGASVHDLTVSIPARSIVAFVGPTGAGKTTVVDLVLGLLEPQDGRLTVDGTCITRENVRAWQRNIGYVPQHIFLSDDTISANIAFGVVPSAIDAAAVERAARVAKLHDFIVHETPRGYDTVVGERGVRLSGGQRQRIGIARALYRDPEVLVLDEATSALDNLTERAVMDAMQSMGGSKTIILITHRLSTVRDCDTIHLMDGGRMRASGTYQSLLDSDSGFRSMAAV